MKQTISLGKLVRTPLLVSIVTLVSASLLMGGKIQTKDGSVINGKILSIEEGVIKVETSYAGEISVKQSEVLTFSSDETINVATDGGNTFKGTVAGDGESIKIAAQGGTFETSVGNVTAAWQPGEDSPKEKALKAEIAANERKWKFDVSADISGKSGNSDRSAIGIGASAVLESRQDKLMFYASIDNAEENDNTTADELKGGIDFSSFFSDSMSWYVRGEMEKDDIELLDLRTTAAFGIGKHVIRKDDQKLEFRGGLAYRYENFNDGSTVESPGLDLALIHYKELSWGTMNNLLTYNPSFDDFGNFRVYHETSFDLPVGTSEFWKLRIGVSNDYNSEPVAGLDELDTTYYARLLLTWR